MKNSDRIAVMDFDRTLNLTQLLSKKSFFLFGPRSTGKSFLVHKELRDHAHVYSLLDNALYLRLQRDPSAIRRIITAEKEPKTLIVIDEIQKIPALLSEVHLLLEQGQYRFLLTGSSARKLRQEGVDLLAGRAWTAHLFPLTWHEIPDFALDRYLMFGGLPQVYPSQDPQEELGAYISTYMKEEIMAEGLVRKLPPFSRFLEVAALSNGQILNYANMGRDAEVSPSTIREYVSVLEDTLLAFHVPAWTKSLKRKATTKAKLYFFDTGVTHWLAGTKHVDRNSSLYGASFEQFIAMELRAYLSYRRIRDELRYWQSTSGFEVNFLIGNELAIEVKATNKMTTKHLKGVKALRDEAHMRRYMVVSQDPINQEHDDILALHWEEFLQRLWNDQLLAP